MQARQVLKQQKRINSSQTAELQFSYLVHLIVYEHICSSSDNETGQRHLKSPVIGHMTTTNSNNIQSEPHPMQDKQLKNNADYHHKPNGNNLKQYLKIKIFVIIG